MKMKNTTLTVAIATALGLISTNALASVFINNTSTSGTILLAEEAPIGTGVIVNTASDRLLLGFNTVPGYTVNSTNPLFVKIALKGGIKFPTGTAPKLVCAVDSAGTTTTTSAAFSTQVNAARTQVTFSIKTGYKMVSSCVIYPQGTATDTAIYNGLTKTTQSISALIEYKNALANATTAYVGDFITFKQAATVVVSPATTTTAANAVIDVKQSSKKFTTATILSTTTAFIGYVAYSATPGVGLALTSGSVPATAILTTATLTIDGAGVAGAQSFALSTAGGCAVDAGTATPSGNTVTFNDVDPLDIAAGLNICMTVDGNTAIDAGQLTATVGGTAVTSWTPVFGDPSQNIHNLTKNGATFRVLNIPASTLADKAYIRLYNTNAFDVVVHGTMYDQTGATIGSSQVIATLTSNQVQILDAVALNSLFGTWTGRARLVIDVEASDFKVQATMRTRSGVLMNMSSEAVD
ncbi:hypothetical protein [Beggiatoa leptomitoformis]|uniref:Uncharacterized protein n=1 Tax=Beggiatoa leptomitoformis TaxID=288004 RepID=A0A2N9YCR4_9GAMM|nr:hypothetical protein [Beggiatoa leptomitoformis]ALG66465.1 hypothetical protein AL038_00325 [Beggiatoa leptomitoformis]AUI68252.1 hypothetical protein BLE401_05745 [Beggiatoa leptomitoformis]